MIENIDYIICPICGKKMQRIEGPHLKAHGITLQEFHEKYPSSKVCCEKNLLNRSLCQKGKKLSEECKKKMSIARKGKTTSLRGKKITEEHRQKIIAVRKGKTYEEIFGKEKADKIKEKMSLVTRDESFKKKISIANLGRKKTPEAREKMRNSSRGIPCKSKNKSYEEIYGVDRAEEIKLNLRNKRLDKLKKYGHRISFNEKSCEVFNEFDALNKTVGQYATHLGEHAIIGYSLDYINFDLKLIIEVDERHHFDKNGNLREKDIIRQKSIEKVLPDFTFLRFKSWEMSEILKINIKDGKIYAI